MIKIKNLQLIRQLYWCFFTYNHLLKFFEQDQNHTYNLLTVIHIKQLSIFQIVKLLPLCGVCFFASELVLRKLITNMESFFSSYFADNGNVPFCVYARDYSFRHRIINFFILPRSGSSSSIGLIGSWQSNNILS